MAKKSVKHKLAQLIKHSSEPVSEQKKHDWEDYLNTLSLEMQPANMAYKIKTAKTLQEFCKKPEHFMLEEFLNNVGLSWETYTKWRGECPELDTAHQFALQQFGIHREKLAMERNLGVNHVAVFTMPHYNKRWRETFEYKAKLTKENETQSGTQYVIIEKFPSSGIVPDKPVSDNSERE